MSYTRISTPQAVRYGMSLEERLQLDVQRGEADACWPWTGCTNRWGYGQVRNQMMHRVAYEVAYGPIPGGQVVRHTCDNPPCCNPAHLLVGTPADNRQDAVERDRHAYGTRHGNHILNDGVVREARRRHASGETGTALAAEYGVSQSAMSCALSGKTWKHVR